MKKFIIVMLLSMFIQTSAVADTINMIDGTVIIGRIDRVISDIINIKTKEGYRKFTTVKLINNRDSVEIGIIKRKVISGKILAVTPLSLEIITPEGLLKVSRLLVRNIVMGQPSVPIEQTDNQTSDYIPNTSENLPEINLY